MENTETKKVSFVDKIKGIKKGQVINALIIGAIICAVIVFTILMLNGTIGVIPKGE